MQIGEGPAVAAAGLSPDKRMLVVQRSPLHLQCLLLPSANMFLQACFAAVLSSQAIATWHLETRCLVVASGVTDMDA